ncbi:hypothetical protein LCGC14_0252380 [marine sediment metagenome]|uniref:Uncharacterized protein n=1 Tax=marine sediment metagenome TaxID=412755 RepID=A0A0F9WPP9_9ZZZZ
MTDPIEYNGKPMRFEPINITTLDMLRLMRRGTPQVVLLEPGDATRYTLLAVPLGTDVASHLDDFGIPRREAHNYLFVSKLAAEECPGTWLPFGSDLTVGTYDVVPLTDNEWSRRFLAWWFTRLYELL